MELYEHDVKVQYIDDVKLNLCANLNCQSSTELLYVGFLGGKDFALMFLMPSCFLAQLKRSCVEVHRWLTDMKIIGVHVDCEGQIFSANKTLYARCSMDGNNQTNFLCYFHGMYTLLKEHIY